MNIVKRITLLKEIYSSKSRFDSKLGVSVHPIPPSITESDLEELNADGYYPNQFITFILLIRSLLRFAPFVAFIILL